MRSSNGHGRILVLFVILLLFSMGSATQAHAMGFSSLWTYRERGGEDRDTLREFQQHYSLGVGPTLTYRPTPAISGRFFLGYSRAQRNLGGDRGWQTVDSVTPTADLNLINDIFRAQLGGYVSRTSSDSGETTTSSWDAGLGSTWQIPYVPTLSLNYGEWSDDEDNLQKTTSAAIAWDVRLAQLFYQYSNTEVEDQLSGGVSENKSHFGRMETGGRLWKNRVSFNLDQQVRYATQKGSVKMKPLSLRTAVTDPVQLPDPDLTRDWTDGELGLEPNPPLQNGDTRDAADGLVVDEAAVRRVHFTIGFASVQPVDKVRFYIDPLIPLSELEDALQWELYVRDPIDGTWKLAVAAQDMAPPLYDSAESGEEKWIDLAVAIGADTEIMAVAIIPAGTSVTFTEVTTFSGFPEDPENTYTAYLTNLSTLVRITRTLQASSALTFENQESERGESSTEDRRLAMSGSLRWSPTPYLMPSLNYSETRQENTGENDLAYRSYGVTVSSRLLPTLSSTLSATRSENFVAEELINRSNRYSLSTTAQIYPDLSAAVYLNYREGESRREDGGFTPTDAYSGRLTLNARINRALTSDFTINYSRSETDTRSTTSSDSTFGLQYRPSDMLSVGMTVANEWIGSDKDASFALFTRLRLLRTPKARLDVRWNHRLADTMSNNFGVDWSWEISRNLYMQTQTNYIMGDKDIYNIQASLSLRL